MKKIENEDIVKKALKIRSFRNIKKDESFCIFDLMDEYKLEVKFHDIVSMEGAFIKDSDAILLSTLRPEGRIRFTCAHEFGHFIFGHGDSFDKVVEKANLCQGNEEERIADLFASFLLAPKTTIISFFNSNNWNISNPSEKDIYKTSSWLGVSYSFLLGHMRFGLKILDENRYSNLKKIKPISIKKEILGFEIEGKSNLIYVNKNWKGRPVDLQVGDLVFFEDEIVGLGPIKLIECLNNNIFQAVVPGVTNVIFKNRGAVIRVRKKEYFGRSKYRHLSED